MKHFFIMRHADAKSSSLYQDADRPLSEKGIRQQAQVISKMKERSHIPDAIYCSPLKRAIETAELVSQEFELSPQILEELGDFSNMDFLISNLTLLESNSNLIIGHAPQLVELVERLTGKNLTQSFETSGYFHLIFKENLSLGKAILERYYSPL